MQKISIKGMVCNRCIYTIRERLNSAGFGIDAISLGNLILQRAVSESEMVLVRSLISGLGFELLSEKKESLLRDIRIALEDLIQINANRDVTIRLSDFLADRFNKSYDSLAEFFSQYEGSTLEQFYINLKIERVKEFLVYTDHSLNEIAHLVGYSSPFHLSGQFKKVTGLNPSYFRSLRGERIKNGIVKAQ